MLIGIRDEETGKEKFWEIPDAAVIAVLAAAATAAILLVF